MIHLLGVTLIITPNTYNQLIDYITRVRPQIRGHKVPQNVPLTAQGYPIRNYSFLIDTICKKRNLKILPSLTEYRKVTVTKAVETFTRSDLNDLHHHMTHSEPAAVRYYQAAGKSRRVLLFFFLNTTIEEL